jgi:hypothetical protein
MIARSVGDKARPVSFGVPPRRYSGSDSNMCPSHPPCSITNIRYVNAGAGTSKSPPGRSVTGSSCNALRTVAFAEFIPSRYQPGFSVSRSQDGFFIFRDGGREAAGAACPRVAREPVRARWSQFQRDPPPVAGPHPTGTRDLPNAAGPSPQPRNIHVSWVSKVTYNVYPPPKKPVDSGLIPGILMGAHAARRIAEQASAGALSPMRHQAPG